ncbi:MAG: hypothetical protein AB7O62_05770 [Pirellulales bacterium]
MIARFVPLAMCFVGAAMVALCSVAYFTSDLFFYVGSPRLASTDWTLRCAVFMAGSGFIWAALETNRLRWPYVAAALLAGAVVMLITVASLTAPLEHP